MVKDSDEAAVEDLIDVNTKSGYDRREEHLNLDCELDEIEIYAEHEIADRYRLTDSLEITAGNPLDCGTVYDVGDIVTVYDRERNVQLDSIISSVETKHTGTEYSVKITLGDSKPKVLDSYVKKGQATASTVRNVLSVGTSFGTIASYEYISDDSVELNGVTYTVEKDTSGLISRITDDIGGELVPEISGEITETTLHNAVVWAAALALGLKRKEADPNTMPFMDGITGYFVAETLGDETNDYVGDFEWVNYLGGENILFNKANITSWLNKKRLGASWSSNGSFASPAEPMTIYVAFVAQAHDRYKNTSIVTKEMAGSLSQYYGFNIMADAARNILMDCTASSVQSYADIYWKHVVCITRNATTAKLYVDGEYIGESPAYLGEYGGKCWVNTVVRNGNKSGEGLGAYYSAIAFGLREHTSEQIAQNSAWLMERYL